MDPFVPVYRFDSRSETFPVSIETLAENSWHLQEDGRWTRAETADGHLRIDQRELNRSDRNPVVYRRTYKWDTITTAHCYVILYMVNYGYRICGSSFGSYHTGDVEHVTVLEQDGKIYRMYYGAHSGSQGNWVEGEDVETVDGHPVVYVSRGSQASYPSAGSWLRIFGLANDLADGLGQQLHPEAIAVDGTEPWLTATLGEISGPGRQSWFHKEDGTTAGCFARFFATFAWPDCLRCCWNE